MHPLSYASSFLCILFPLSYASSFLCILPFTIHYSLSPEAPEAPLQHCSLLPVPCFLFVGCWLLVICYRLSLITNNQQPINNK